MASPRAWQRMLSGRRLNLLDPSPLDVEIEDIAQGLSRVARWNGQTSGDWAFSVAQHSLLVEDLVRRLKPDASSDWLLAALLHDAPEYVVGDMITPFKSAIGPDYKALENRLLAAVHLRFGLHGRDAPRSGTGYQARRSRRRLSGSNATRRLCAERSQASVRRRGGGRADRADSDGARRGQNHFYSALY